LRAFAQRSGLYPNKAGWPLTLGFEAAGTIAALPDTPPKGDADYDARKFAVGQKVAVVRFAFHVALPPPICSRRALAHRSTHLVVMPSI